MKVRPLFLAALLLLHLAPGGMGSTVATEEVHLAGEGAVWFSFDQRPGAGPVSVYVAMHGVNDFYESWVMRYDANGTFRGGFFFSFRGGTLELTVVGDEPVDLPPVVIRPLVNGTFETSIGISPTGAGGTIVYLAAGGQHWEASVTPLETNAPPTFVHGRTTFLTTREFEGGIHLAASALTGVLRVDHTRAHTFETTSPAILAFGKTSSSEASPNLTSLRLHTPTGTLVGPYFSVDLTQSTGAPAGTYRAEVDDIDLLGGSIYLLVAQPTLFPAHG